MTRLKRIDCSAPGITRRRRGRGFEYLDATRSRVTSGDVLHRIRALAIPPAWTEVWICADPNGHLQATGIDAAGRKQYLYHPRWRERRDQEKFERMLDFAGARPRLRKLIRKDLRSEELGRRQVLACALRLLDRGFFRIGSEDYAEQNDSFGLATILKSHVTIKAASIRFGYIAKIRRSTRSSGRAPLRRSPGQSHTRRCSRSVPTRWRRRRIGCRAETATTG